MPFAWTLRRNSIGLKVLLAFAGGTVLSIALLMLVGVALVQSQALARIDLAGVARDMAERIRFDADGRPLALEADADDLGWVFDALGQETAYRVLDAQGRTAFMSAAGAAPWRTAGPPAPGRFEVNDGGVLLLGATELLERDGKQWYFQMAVSTRLMGLLHRVAMPLVSAGIALFSVVLLLSFCACAWLTLRYALAPLRDVSESAAAITPRMVHARLDANAIPFEIAPLVESFNAALARLEHGYRLQQDFLAHAAHELKTPLSLIQAQIELSGGDAGERAALLGDVAYMTRQVQQLLLLAEVSELQNYRFASVDVGQTAQEAMAFARRAALAAGIELSLSVPAQPVIWTADAQALFTLLKNLIENAVQHAPRGSVIELDVERYGLCVRDHGPGVDAALLPRLFERFWRGGHRRDQGTGLGLSICREIALAHGWTLDAERAEPGLRMRLRVPSLLQSD